MAYFELKSMDKLQYLLAMSIFMLVLRMTVAISTSICISRFGILIIFATVGIGNFGESNNAATRKPATYRTLALLIRMLTDHALSKEPVATEARYLNDIVRLQTNSGLVCARCTEADTPAL